MNHLIEDNLTCLEQGIRLLEGLPPDVYGRRCAICFDSAIGGHMRHNLDHYEQFLDGYAGGRIDYDARSRKAEIETHPEAAIAAMRSLRAGLSAVADSALDQSVEVRMDGGQDATWSVSSVRRELQFLISHTIHHYALIAAISQAHGFADFPSGFGVAPSTLKYRAAQA